MYEHIYQVRDMWCLSLPLMSTWCTWIYVYIHIHTYLRTFMHEYIIQDCFFFSKYLRIILFRSGYFYVFKIERLFLLQKNAAAKH